MKPVVIKRDGCRAPFNGQLIRDAVSRAAAAVNQASPALAERIAAAVSQELEGRGEVDIHEIQNRVENHLMASDDKAIARAYIEYRHDRDQAREARVAWPRRSAAWVEQTNAALLNENANKDSKVILTQRDLLAGIVAKHYAISHMLPQDVVQAHESGDLHFHDLDYSPSSHVQLHADRSAGDADPRLQDGQRGDRHPKSISTATAVTAQIIAQVASHIYGGTTINRIDEVLAPYVTISWHKHREVAEEWGSGTWMPTPWPAPRRSATTPSSPSNTRSIPCTPPTVRRRSSPSALAWGQLGIAPHPARHPWQPHRRPLARTGRPPSSLKLVFAIKDGLNHKPGDPNYDIKQLALECASKRMYPDILNHDQVVKVTGSFKTPMGCRSFLGAYEENGELVHEGATTWGREPQPAAHCPEIPR